MREVNEILIEMQVRREKKIIPQVFTCCFLYPSHQRQTKKKNEKNPEFLYDWLHDEHLGCRRFQKSPTYLTPWQYYCLDALIVFITMQ